MSGGGPPGSGPRREGKTLSPRHRKTVEQTAVTRQYLRRQVPQLARELYNAYCYTTPEVYRPPVALEGNWALVDFVKQSLDKYCEIRVYDSLDRIVVHTKKGKIVFRAP